MINEKQIRNYVKGKGSWPILRYDPEIFLYGLRNTTGNVGQESQYPWLRSKPEISATRSSGRCVSPLSLKPLLRGVT